MASWLGFAVTAAVSKPHGGSVRVCESYTTDYVTHDPFRLTDKPPLPRFFETSWVGTLVQFEPSISRRRRIGLALGVMHH